MTGSRALASMALGLVILGLLGCEPPAVPGAPAGGGGAPQVACQGVPDSICKQALDTTGAVQGTVAQVIVRCSKPICTEQLGEADVLIIFVDGRRETSNYGWASAPAAPAPIPVITPPALAVQPECQGLPLQKCQEMASSMDPEEMARPIESIIVRCNGVCTPASGQGQTIVHHADESTDLTIDWVYGNGG